MPTCNHCGEEVCMWIEFEPEVIETTEYDIACDITLIDDMIDNKLKRKRAYRVYTAIVHGWLGKGVRKRIPTCVKRGIRSHYPSTTYMGHRDS